MRRPGATCSSFRPRIPEAGASCASVSQRTRRGRRCRRPQFLPCESSAVRGPHAHTSSQRRMKQRSRHRGPRFSHRRSQRLRHLRHRARRWVSASTWAEPPSARPRTPSEPTPRAPSPWRILRRGAEVANRFAISSKLRESIENLRHGVKATSTDLAGGERWGMASGRPREPCPPVTGRIVHDVVVIERCRALG